MNLALLCVLQSKNALNEKQTALIEFFRLHSLSPSLLIKTTSYVDALWSVNRGIDHHTLLGELPRHIREEVLVAAHA